MWTWGWGPGGQYRLNKEKGGSLMERDGRPQGPTYTCPPDRISASPPPSPLLYSDPCCSVYRRGGVHPCLFKRYWPLWLPVRALHHISSPYLQCIDHNGRPYISRCPIAFRYTLT